jgi:hypothetical protein
MVCRMCALVGCLPTRAYKSRHAYRNLVRILFALDQTGSIVSRSFRLQEQFLAIY